MSANSTDVTRRSVPAALGAGRAVAAVGAAPASSGVPHSLQKRPEAGDPHPGHSRGRGEPHDEQNLAPSALVA